MFKPLKKKVVQVIVNIAAWACFLMLPFVFFSRPKDASFIAYQPLNPYLISSNLLFIAFYYFNGYFLLPRLLARKKIFLYSITIVALLIFFGIFPRMYDYLSDHFFNIPRAPWRFNRPPNVARPLLSPGSIAIFLLVFIISTGVRVVSQWFQS